MKKNNKRESIIIAVILLVILAVAFYLDAKLPSYHIAIKVIKKAAVYSLVAVSMNLLNGFTGLFSLGQAGFMLLGAYAYAVLSIPVAKRAGVYQYFDGGIGSIPGAVVGAFIIGLCEELIKGIGYSTFSDAFTFVILIVVLCVKPTGLFGEKATDKV